MLANPTEDKINDAIALYKKGQYSEVIKNLNTIISQDDSYPVAYYYLGLSYAKLNKKDLAIENYNNVMNKTSDRTLKTMAKAAKDCLGTSGFTALDAQLTLRDASKAEKFVKPMIKREVKPTSSPKVAKTFVKPQDKISKAPSNAEIGEAIMVLKKAGLWNGNNQASITQPQSQQDQIARMQMQQMQQQMSNPAYLMMGMNGNNNNNNGGMNMMNMMPFMMNNGNGNSSPEQNQQLLQTMMMSQMMPNLDFSSSDNK